MQFKVKMTQLKMEAYAKSKYYKKHVYEWHIKFSEKKKTPICTDNHPILPPICFFCKGSVVF